MEIYEKILYIVFDFQPIVCEQSLLCHIYSRFSREGAKLTAYSFYHCMCPLCIVDILQIFLSTVDICPMCNVNILLEHLSGLAAQASVLTVLMPFVHCTMEPRFNEKVLLLIASTGKIFLHRKMKIKCRIIIIIDF